MSGTGHGVGCRAFSDLLAADVSTRGGIIRPNFSGWNWSNDDGGVTEGTISKSTALCVLCHYHTLWARPSALVLSHQGDFDL